MEPRLHPVGERRDMTPILPLPEHTTYFELGALKIGVERREFNDDVLQQRLAGDPKATEITEQLFEEKGVDRRSVEDTGVSIHVFDAETGERYKDVIVFWVPSEDDKRALVQDEHSPFFTTPHFNGHLSVLLRAARVGELSRQELAEVVQDAWLSRASRRRADEWLKSQA